MSSLTLTRPDSAAWRDPKRYLWLLGAPVLLLPISGGLLAQATGVAIFWWWAVLFVYGVIPLLDWLIGADPSNPPESAVAQLEADRYYRCAVYAAVPLQLITVTWACWTIAHETLPWYSYLGLTLSVGVVSGVGINTAHELGHKTESLERWLAKLALTTSAYGHFFVEHNRGHHVRVATPEDPASARLGENFYAFLPRSMIGGLRSAWALERQRLARQGHGVWSWRNDNLQAWGMTLGLFAGLTAAFGWKVLPFLLLQAFYGASLLEVVNYLEHYGLCRQKLPSGRYERCEPTHSWNSNHIVTNLLLYQLQRHSDHHANPTRSFQALRHFDASPQLPSGYASMIMVAYLPWLWFRIMDRRVTQHYQGDLREANIQPRLRARLLARQAVPTA